MLRMKMVIGETLLLYSDCVMFWIGVWEWEMIRSSLEGRGAEFMELFKSEANGHELSR